MHPIPLSEKERNNRDVEMNINENLSISNGSDYDRLKCENIKLEEEYINYEWNNQNISICNDYQDELDIDEEAESEYDDDADQDNDDGILSRNVSKSKDRKQKKGIDVQKRKHVKLNKIRIH